MDKNEILGSGGSVMKTVSIIIPVYNAEKTLRRCLDSVLAQSYTSYEAVVVDDGSTDKSGEICYEYSRADKRIKVIHKKNGGVSSARNCGIDHADGDYCFFLDSDDYIKADFLQTWYDCTEKTSSDVFISSLYTVDESGEFVKFIKPHKYGVFASDIWCEVCVDSEFYGLAGGKMVVLKSLLDDNNIRYDGSIYSQEDLKLCTEIYSKAKRVCVPDYAGYYYYYAQPKRKPQFAVYVENQYRIISYARKAVNVSREAENAVRERIVRILFSCLYTLYKNEDEFTLTADKIRGTDGLCAYLTEEKIKGEKGIIISRFVKGKYGSIIKHFKLREKVKKLLGR